jgi:hypothetical protein
LCRVAEYDALLFSGKQLLLNKKNIVMLKRIGTKFILILTTNNGNR